MCAPPEIIVSYQITRESPGFKIKALLAEFNIIADEMWDEGDLISKNGALKHDTTGCTLVSIKRKDYDLDTAITAVLDRIRETPNFKQLRDKYLFKAELSCVIYAKSNSFPSISLDHALLARLAKLNLALDIDIYNIPSSNEKI